MSSHLSRLALCTALVSLPALGSEKPVAQAKVPKRVMQTVATAYPKAKVLETVIETEDNRKLYEVRLANGPLRVDLKIDESGKLVTQEHVLDLAKVPVAITNAALAPPYQDYKVLKVEKVDNLETPAASGYEVVVGKDGNRRELLLSPEAKFLRDEQDDDEK